MTCGIYTITCDENNVVYVGQSSNIKSRWGDHRKKLKANKHYNKFMQSSYNKYGVGTFHYNIHLECEIEDLNSNEQFVADQLQLTGVQLFNVGAYLPAPARGIKRHDNATRLKGYHANPFEKSYLMRGLTAHASRIKGTLEAIAITTKASHSRVKKSINELKNKPNELCLHKGTAEHSKMKSDLIKARYLEGTWGIGIQTACKSVIRLDTNEIFISIGALARNLNTSKPALLYQLNKGKGICKGVAVAYSGVKK